MADWKTLSSEVVYETPWIKVRKDQVLNHVGKELTYGLVECKNPFVMIVAMNDKDEILVFQNYRYSLGGAVWELPAGFTDGDDYLACAQRELLEETGFETSEWTCLGHQFAASGIGRIPFTVYLARHINRDTPSSEQDEQITNQSFFDIATIEKMAMTGEIPEACALTALYLTKLHLQKQVVTGN